MVGNGVTDRKFDGNALVPFAHGMALISDQIYEVPTLFDHVRLTQYINTYLGQLHIYILCNNINARREL